MAKTLKDIAAELHTSPSTLSRVMNDKGNVNEATRQRILKGLKNTEYVPNQVARSLKKSSTKTIGIIVPDYRETFFGNIIRGIDEVVSENGYSIILADSNEKIKKEKHCLDLFFRQRVDALIIATVDINGVDVKNYLDDDIPVVFIDNLPNINGPFDAVLIDNWMAGKMAVDHCVTMGHEKIAFISGKKEETTGGERLRGYMEALSSYGIDVDENLIKHGDFKEESGFLCMETLINNRKKHPFSAVIVSSEMMTIGAIKRITTMGLKMPDDIALVGFDFHDRTGLVRPSISTIRQPESEIGILTAETILRKLKRKEKNSNVMVVSGQKMLLSPMLEINESSRRG